MILAIAWHGIQTSKPNLLHTWVARKLMEKYGFRNCHDRTGPLSWNQTQDMNSCFDPQVTGGQRHHLRAHYCPKRWWWERVFWLWMLLSSLFKGCGLTCQFLIIFFVLWIVSIAICSIVELKLFILHFLCSSLDLILLISRSICSIHHHSGAKTSDFASYLHHFGSKTFHVACYAIFEG